jgi:Fic family protein
MCAAQLARHAGVLFDGAVGGITCSRMYRPAWTGMFSNTPNLYCVSQHAAQNRSRHTLAENRGLFSASLAENMLSDAEIADIISAESAENVHSRAQRLASVPLEQGKTRRTHRLCRMEWFLGCLGRAIDGAQVTLSAVLGKARFWERIKGVQLNDRQRLVINRLIDGFEGKLTTSKYAQLAKCSQDTAHRDILALVDHGVLVRNPEGGRSTSYSLAPS